MSTDLRLIKTTTVPSAGPSTTYRDLVFVDRWTSGTLTLDTDTAAGPAERPFRIGGTGSAIRFYSERVASEFTLSGTVTFTLSSLSSDAGFTGRLRARLSKITHGGSNIETFIGVCDATADITTTTTLFTLSFTPSPAIVIAANERLIVQVTAIPTGAGGTDFGTGFATHRYGLFTSGVQLTETVTFLPNGTTLRLKRTATTGIGTFKDLLEPLGSSAFVEAKIDTVGGATELQWTDRTQTGTIAVTELTAAAIASTTNAATYASASFTPVANRLYLLAVTHSDTAPEATVPTISTTTGLNFVQIGSSIAFNTIASNQHRLTVFRAMKASGLSAGTYTVTLADAGTGCAAILAEVTGVVTSGTDGANAVRNINQSAVDVTANPNVLFINWLESYNAAVAVFANSLGTTPTATSGYTALSNQSYGSPTTGLFAEWKSPPVVDGSSLIQVTLASSSYAATSLELVAAYSSASIEWISPRVKMPWRLDSNEHVSGMIAAFHYGVFENSNDPYNAGLRVKLFHRAPNGTETLVYTVTSTAEIVWSTPTTLQTWTTADGTLNQAMNFAEDDRLVLRVYLTNVGGTMVAGTTASLEYDHNVAGSGIMGDARVTVYVATTFKAESDPPASGHVEGGQTMSGIGN